MFRFAQHDRLGAGSDNSFISNATQLKVRVTSHWIAADCADCFSTRFLQRKIWVSTACQLRT